MYKLKVRRGATNAPAVPEGHVHDNHLQFKRIKASNIPFVNPKKLIGESPILSQPASLGLGTKTLIHDRFRNEQSKLMQYAKEDYVTNKDGFGFSYAKDPLLAVPNQEELATDEVTGFFQKKEFYMIGIVVVIVFLLASR